MIDFEPDGVGGFFGPPGVLAKAVAVSGGGWDVVSQEQITDRFDATGRLVSRKDRSGQGVVMSYDVAGRLSLVTDASGRTLTLSYGTTVKQGTVSLSKSGPQTYEP